MTAPKRLAPGDIILPRRLPTIRGAEVSIPDRARLVHLQFRRFAGCPACNLHLRAFDRRWDELTAAGVHEVVVFHSSTEALRRDLTEMRFDVIADPSKELYVAHGVESSLWSVLHPRAWGALAGGMLRGLAAPPASGEGALGLPADFLIASDGRILACKYGTHADDQWSVDEVIALAAPGRSTPRRAGIFYWIPTLAVALAFLGAGIGNLVHAPHIVDDLALLGYPPYFPRILGTWKVLGGLAIVVPHLPRLKEWAYAGIIFDLTGAAASRTFAGDPAVAVVIPLAIAALALASWALRPANRRM